MLLSMEMTWFYHGYQDIGVAVSTSRGLMVPVLRNTEAMGLG